MGGHYGPGMNCGMERLITAEYDERLDKLLLVKGIWEATRDVFTDVNAQNKVNTALNPGQVLDGQTPS